MFNNPSEMSTSERMFLYSLVRGHRPQRILEIGSRHGGSAAIMSAAMMDADENGAWTITGIDPEPQIKVPLSRYYGRFNLIKAPSPEAIAQARDSAGAPFDFALIDGLHIYTQVKADFEGVLPHLVDGSYILFHDAFHLGVATAIEEIIQSRDDLIDCGYPCNRAAVKPDQPVAYGGFRLVLFSNTRTVNYHKFVKRGAEKSGFAVPPQDPDLADHDPYWKCKKVEPCAYCRKMGLNSRQ